MPISRINKYNRWIDNTLKYFCTFQQYGLTQNYTIPTPLLHLKSIINGLRGSFHTHILRYINWILAWWSPLMARCAAVTLSMDQSSDPIRHAADDRHSPRGWFVVNFCWNDCACRISKLRPGRLIILAKTTNDGRVGAADYRSCLKVNGLLGWCILELL